MLDAVFCKQGGRFRNEITWKRTFSHNDAIGYGRIKDTIFFYTKSDKFVWNKIYQSYDAKYVKDFYKNKDERGVYQADTMTGPGINPNDPEYKGYHPNKSGRSWSISRKTVLELAGEKAKSLSTLEKLELLDKHNFIAWSKNGTPRFKRYLDEMKGVPLQDIWTDIPPISSQARERLGYPTQKPEVLLERIIKASSNEGDVVFDAFCGCGTTVAVAQRLNRKWIGIDITYQSISLIIKRLTDSHGNDMLDNINIGGIPRDIESAKALALKKDDRLRKEFEKWSILTYSDNRAMINSKKGKDYGIDGKIPVPEGGGQFRDILFSVKSGKVSSSMIRDFRGVIERENAAAGVFITLNEPTKDMRQEAAGAGLYNSEYMRDIEKIKIVTVQQILNGERLGIGLAANVLRKAEQVVGEQEELF